MPLKSGGVVDSPYVKGKMNCGLISIEKLAKYHFFSGFENGNLSDFDGTFTFLGDLAVLAAAKYSGSYGLRARVFTTDFFGKAWVYKLLSPKLSLLSCECRWKLLDALNVDDIIGSVYFLTGEPTPPEFAISYIGVKRLNGGYVWYIGYFQDVGWTELATSQYLSLNTWYKTKMETKIDPSEGYTKCWIDDTLIFNSGNIANDDRGNVGSCRGGTEHFNFKPPTTMNVYVDDVTIDP